MKRWLSAAAVLLSGVVAGAQQAPAPQDTPPASEPRSILFDPETAPLDSLVVAARFMISQENYKDAQAVLDAVLRRDPRYVDAVVVQGELKEASGDRQTAREQYLLALRIKPTDFRANLNLGRFYLYTNLSRQAIPFLEQAERFAPPDQRTAALTLLAMGYRAKGERQLAIETADRATRESPENLEAWHLKVTTLSELRRYDRADVDSQTLVEQALALTASKPGNRPALEELVRAFDTRLFVLRQLHRSNYRMNAAGVPTDQLLPGREQAAARVLTEIIDVVQRKMVADELRGMHELATLAREAVMIEPRNVQHYLRLGGILRMVHDHVGAAETYRAALKVDPENAEAHAALNELGVSAVAPSPTVSPAPAEAVPTDAPPANEPAAEPAAADTPPLSQAP